ncbi:selenate reductase Fe-S subunit [Enterobacter sp. BIGb0383]|uniref:putative selenate reductase subunit YgfK n=1 Tax=unclassified Enterobacter TaxID=2608935 RepID=UPI000F484EAD|nr:MULTISPECIES: putative selenate reductase subunit YgfK [unclassified Enterobacter]ROP62591.1 selenate reductase Fe-S subunit [Enterobacter sp. BIGb0383]ROS12752.1 selenate reductase Fe-S subunit [Enterobacter sp. BIGb0359]
MGDIMRPVPFEELLTRIFDEYQNQGSIFGIPERQFYSPDTPQQVNVFGENCATPVGPAAGPHTQLAQNIITSWLTGGRFIELKTVQILDRLELEKPCIDAEDECFNTEWSTEFTLKKAWDEYLKAWFILHLLEEVFPLTPDKNGRSFIFNMSVGYNLDGIKQPPMQEFIDSMMDASAHPKFAQYRDTLNRWVHDETFITRLKLETRRSRLEGLAQRVPATLVHGVTLSTMHGCPPDEIEAICRYMLEEKDLNTFVKLNPTLLGYPRVRQILDTCGFGYIGLSEESFAHDLKLGQALEMLTRLLALAQTRNLGFGVKLTNTLGTINHKGALPGNEMYMSGRALFPLSINVAALLSREFDGKLPISYSGGASQLNIRDIFETGIRPITMATDLLKPGGYLRLSACMRELENADGWDMTQVDVARLNALAEKAVSMAYTQKQWKPEDRIDVARPLPMTDCYVAPCVTACAIKQDIPEYIRLLGEHRYADALELIYQRNALPAITGHICDHQCQYNCTRLDYDSALNIRELKKVALEKGWEEYQKRWHKPAGSGAMHPVAVIGAGPAGLAAGYFLARAGHSVTLFEREASAGGVVKNVIPAFRIPGELIQQDIDFVVNHGVKIEYGCDPHLTVEKLQRQGFRYVLVGTGTEKNSGVTLSGDNQNIYTSLQFLREFNRGDSLQPGRHVAIVGAGNTAMDCARAALRIPGVETATIIYRRSRQEMPAWREEYEEALQDGVQFQWLSNPEQFNADGTLIVRVMALGEPDEKGRRRPVATDETRTLHIDMLITAIGEQQDCEALAAMGIPLDAQGWPEVSPDGETRQAGVFLIGDVQRGPSSIVSAIGNARRATDIILARENIASHHGNKAWSNVDPADIYLRKGLIAIDRVDKDDRDAFVAQEVSRCLECNYICSKCVDVCPNRANVSVAVPGFQNRYQTLHLDAYCNECGNCAQFCPWQGKPYKDKTTVFSLEQDFINSSNPGFFVDGHRVHVRQDDRTWQLDINDGGQFRDIPPQLNAICRIISHVHQHHNALLGEVER